MSRTQLNINIDPELFKKVKASARQAGKSLTGYVSDCFANQLVTDSSESIDDKFSKIEERLISIEKTLLELAPGSYKIKPFTPQEAEKCNEFIKAFFHKEVERKKYKSNKDAWMDLISHIKCFDQWNDIYTFRLQEAIFIDHGDPLSSDEMNHLTKGKECPCPIRTGLINWKNNADPGQCCCADNSFPSQQSICEKGSSLIKNI